MFEVTSDPGEGAHYVALTKEPFVGKNKVFEGKYGTICVDFDREGNVTGVEFLTN